MACIADLGGSEALFGNLLRPSCFYIVKNGLKMACCTTIGASWKIVGSLTVESTQTFLFEACSGSSAIHLQPQTRVYHGSLTKLPRRYITRERLCLRAATDYWVNALDGAPFFCVTQPIDLGLQKTLEADIIPRLLTDVPQQPTQAELDADPLRHRFTIVFDREGYSPDLFARLEEEQRIAILTYHKHPGAD